MHPTHNRPENEKGFIVQQGAATMSDRRFARLVLAAALTLGLTGAAFGQNDNKPKNNNPNKQERQENRNRDDRELPGSLTKATDLIGMRVDDKDGKRIGDIRNLAVNAEHGHVRYAIVDNGRGTFYAIPTMAFHYEHNQKTAIVNTTADRMKDAPVFKPEGWSTIGDPSWGKKVYEFYSIDRTPDMDKEPTFVPAGDVIGGHVESPRGEGLGTIKDLAVDTSKHDVAYAVLEGGQNKLFAAPWEALNFKDNGKKVVLRGVERDDLKDAPGFANSHWPTTKDLGWKSDTNFDSRPPHWLYGLKDNNGNGGGNNTGGGGGKRDDDERGALGGWQTNSKYGQMFKKNAVEHFDGTIVRTDKITPLNGMDPGVGLVVKESGDRTWNVHLGPEWFIRHQQDSFKDGEKVQIVGSKVEVDGKPVIMATQVRMQGRVMTLRDPDGVPLWDAWQERK
jgi:sporulation protein YlmC with PRC-barrel domain